jgi:hypothetical protein
MTVKLSTQEVLAQSVANNILTASNATQAIDKDCQAIRKARKNKPLGTVKSGCAVMIRFVEVLSKAGKAEQTVKNLATAFRKAVNDGVPFSMNAYRKPVAKGAQTSPKAKGAKVASVNFKGDASVDDIVKGLRNLFNKFKADDKTATLASFLLDGLDEYEESK